jgi:hypothetical protein
MTTGLQRQKHAPTNSRTLNLLNPPQHSAFPFPILPRSRIRYSGNGLNDERRKLPAVSAPGVEAKGVAQACLLLLLLLLLLFLLLVLASGIRRGYVDVQVRLEAGFGVVAVNY